MNNRDEIQAKIDACFPGHLGIRLQTVTAEEVLAELDVRAEVSTIAGSLHGGAMMAFADTLGAIGTVVNLKPGQWTTTIDSSSKFLAAPGAGSTVTGRSRPLHRGGRTMVWHTEIFSEDGKLCAVVTQTQLVLANKN